MLRSCLSKGVVVFLVTGLLAWSTLQGSSPAASRGYAAVPTGSAVFFQPSRFTALTAAPAPAPTRVGVGNSVMPHTESECSVMTLGNADSACSAFNTAARRCSAHCDANQRCSAFWNGGMGRAFCSVFGIRASRCSVLPPIGSIQPSRCSSFGGDNVHCSVLGSGNTRQACSAQNPGSPGNFCSATQLGFLGGLTPDCSVLSNDSNRGGFCSTAGAGLKTCSALGQPQPNGGPAVCSIAMNQRGACTAFRGAPSSSCSVQQAPGACSVISAPTPSNHCRLP